MRATAPENESDATPGRTDGCSGAPAPTEQPFVWHCLLCGRRHPFGYAELGRFARVGWPKCCDHTVLASLARVADRAAPRA